MRTLKHDGIGSYSITGIPEMFPTVVSLG